MRKPNLRITSTVLGATFVAALICGVGINATLASPSALLSYYGPPSPTSVQATAKCSAAHVTWAGPDGGDPSITGYAVWVRLGGQIVASDVVAADTFSDTVTGLSNGVNYAITVASLDTQGQGSESDPAAQVSPVCPTSTLALTSDPEQPSNGSFTPTSQLTSTDPACVSGQTVTFSLDTNPATLDLVPYPLGSATADPSGVATAPSIPTTGWVPGIYYLTVAVAATADCPALSITELLVVYSTRADVDGSGKIAVNGKTQFALDIEDDARRAGKYVGKLTVQTDGQWKIRGTITSLKYSMTSGTSQGTGDLYYWALRRSPSTGRLSGTWVLAKRGVSFTVKFTASTHGVSRPPTGLFGIRINYTPGAGQPPTLPNTDPVPLTDGHIDAH